VTQSRPKIEFRAIMMAFRCIVPSLFPHSQWVNGQLSRSGSWCKYVPLLSLGIFERICRSSKGDHRGPSTRTHRFSAKSRIVQGFKIPRSIFIVRAFDPHRDGCPMPLGGVEFAVFSEPLEADIKTRVNGEYLWGRH
jgi:hypothetical protein